MMSIADWIGLVALVCQTGALFYWGGEVRQMLRDHDRRLTSLEEARDAHARRLSAGHGGTP